VFSVLGLGKTNLSIFPIEDGGVSSDESITQNKSVVEFSRQSSSFNTNNAALTLLDNVVFSRDNVIVTTNGESEVGHIGEIITVGDLTDLLLDFLTEDKSTNDDGSTRVNDSFHITLADIISANLDLVQLKGIVSLFDQGVEGEGSDVELGIEATQDKSGASDTVVGKIELELSLFDGTLSDGVLEGSGGVVSRDAFVGQTEDTFEFGDDESNTFELGHQSKGLVLDFDTTPVKVVSTQISLSRATSVVDVEGGSVVLEAGGLGVVKFGMELAGNGGTVLSHNPKVGRTSIKDDLEGLGGGTKAHGSVELSIKVVGQGDFVGGEETFGIFNFHQAPLGLDETVFDLESLPGSLLFSSHLGDGDADDGEADSKESS